jgi:hypothetical protein
MTWFRALPKAKALGLSALAFSVLYLLSDVVEAVQGGFSEAQLWMTLVAEAAIPVVVIGLYVVQRPQMRWLGRASALVYAYAFVFFTGTVAYALVEGVSDYATLSSDLAPWMTIHGALMVLAGSCFAYAVVIARVLPRWTGFVLMAGVILVAASQGASEPLQVLAAGIRDLGFAGMGLALMGHGAKSPRHTRAASPVADGLAL